MELMFKLQIPNRLCPFLFFFMLSHKQNVNLVFLQVLTINGIIIFVPQPKQ